MEITTALCLGAVGAVYYEGFYQKFNLTMAFYTFTPCYAIVVTNKRVRELDIDLKLEDGILDFLFTE